ncbi:hypothetical protein Cni_G24046 [Canna indica]|uniref:ENT domain-containing protein n=1 Tax=Canna indica TaxID=4628 RepID=A0AAQ3KV91_9LILI|nr:hypothetical protein Cni_G24046 [Canna indica]
MRFKEGKGVEVLRRKEDQFDSWFPAKILSVHGSTYTVRYKLFLTSLGEPVVETVNVEDVRPRPPVLNVKEQWVAGEVAEVLDLYAWRVGKVVKLLKNNRVVIKLCGSIQLKEYYVSDIRVPQAWQNDQWTMTGKGCGGTQFGSVKVHTSSKHVRKLDCGASQGIEFKQAPAVERSKQKHGQISISIMKRNLDPHCGFSPVVLDRVMDRKRKPNEDIPHKLAKRALHKKVGVMPFSKDIVTENFLHKSIKATDKGYAYNHLARASSIPLQDAEENNECSVASCSGNEYPGYTNQNLEKHPKDTAFNSFGDAMSICPLDGGREYQSKTGDEIAVNVHTLELQAYQSTMQALHASGPLSWEQESLLTNLRLSLNISNEEHLLHLKQLLSA